MKKTLISLITLVVILSANGGILSVQWPQKSSVQEKIQKDTPMVLKDKIKDVKLPVLLPKSYIVKQKMSVVAEKNYYAITIFLKGANLMISGDKTYQMQMKDIDKKSQKMLKQSRQEFINAEGMMITDFSRYGVNYSMQLECDEVERDKRCSDDKFLREIYRQLVIVGGRR